MKVNILKNLGMVLLASFLGIMANPEMLMASDSVAVYGVDTSNVVETAVETPIVTTVGAQVGAPVGATAGTTVGALAAGVVESVKVAESVNASAKAVETIKTTEAVKAAEPVSTNYVRFSWGTQEVFRANSTAVNAGNRAARMGKLIWGHNYTSFGNIVESKTNSNVGLKIGDTFTISENGKTTTYKVAANPINGAAGVVLDKKSEAVLSYAGDARYSNIDMNALINYGMGHSLVLMTCYGSNSRYVVVADAM